MKLHTASLLASVLSLAVAGCGGQSTPTPETPLVADPPPPSPSPEPAAATPAPPPAETAATPPTPAEKPLTDEEIAAIVTTVNTGEIDQAKLALTHAKDFKVKQFAQLMIQHHTKSNQDAEKILAKSSMKPADNHISQKLAADSKALVESWKGTKGADFDKAYLDAQVKQHQDVLAMMDAKLLPQVKNEEMKQSLTAFRPVVEAHLKQAQELQGKLAGAGAPGTTPGGSKGSTPPPAATTPPAAGPSSSAPPPKGGGGTGAGATATK